jgi:hypothetical protein
MRINLNTLFSSYPKPPCLQQPENKQKDPINKVAQKQFESSPPKPSEKEITKPISVSTDSSWTNKAIQGIAAISGLSTIGGIISTALSPQAPWWIELLLNRSETPKIKLGFEEYSQPAHWYTRWWKTDPRKEKPTESPIFKADTAHTFHKLQQHVKGAVEKKDILPHAIFIGPKGTGKSMACATIARSANVNYLLATESNFIDFMQHSDDVARFFEQIQKNHYPTILLIDDAELLLKSEETIAENEKLQKTFQQLKTYAATNNHKMMILFTTNLNKQDINPTFLTRMTYTVIVDKPTPKELKEIVRQRAEIHFGPSARQVFTPEVINYLVEGKGCVKGVFSGKIGRDIRDAFIDLRSQINIKEKPKGTMIADKIQEYFDSKQTNDLKSK